MKGMITTQTLRKKYGPCPYGDVVHACDIADKLEALARGIPTTTNPFLSS